MTSEKITDRVRKMLALAKNEGATEAERDAAMRNVRKTVAKYNLDLEALEKEGSKEADVPRGIFTLRCYGRPWARRVAAQAAKLCFCEYLVIPATKAKNTQHLFIGREENARAAAALAEFLIDSIHTEAARHKRWGGGEAYRSFAWGAAHSIYLRVAELLKPEAEESSGEGKALVLIGQKEQEKNQLVVKAKFPELSKTRTGKGIHDNMAYAAGRAFGDRLPLDKQAGKIGHG